MRVLAHENLKITRLLAGLRTFPRNVYRAVNAERDDREQGISEVCFDRYLRYTIHLKRIAVWRLQYLWLVEQPPEQAVGMHGCGG